MSGELRHRVFVYGTLKRGQRNCHYLRDAEYVGRFVTRPGYSMYCFDSYPAVCLGGRHAVYGEVFHVSDAQFERLDELELYPDYYQRIEIATRYGDAWMYVVTRERCRGRPLVTGDWSESP